VSESRSHGGHNTQVADLCSDEHFFQLGLRQFGALNKIRLEPAPDLRELLRLAAADEPGIAQNGLDAEQVVEV
jgi:DNA mismatch repair protein MLH1